jgi:CDP-glycerol glycerophosphotransferase (TagB/SpsB family)
MMNRHAERFRDMDAFVDTTYAALRFKTRYGYTQAKYILAFHGAGDRKRKPPEYLRSHDFLLLYGPKYYQRLNQLGVLTDDNWAYLGYPKFDVTLHEQAPSPVLFPEQRTTVLYNPHFESDVSSWFDWGWQVLDFFANSQRYNLIFAPHVELKGRTDPRLSVKKYAAMPNVHVDLGSPSCLDMTYLKAADIYLGDVSSQVTEFLVQPRPCVFLNNHQIDWENNAHYMLWKAGPVVEDLSLLEQSIEDAINSHERYRSAQLEYFNDSINLTETPSGLRGAQAIYEFLENS